MVLLSGTDQPLPAKGDPLDNAVSHIEELVEELESRRETGQAILDELERAVEEAREGVEALESAIGSLQRVLDTMSSVEERYEPEAPSDTSF